MDDFTLNNLRYPIGQSEAPQVYTSEILAKAI